MKVTFNKEMLKRYYRESKLQEHSKHYNNIKERLEKLAIECAKQGKKELKFKAYGFIEEDLVFEELKEYLVGLGLTFTTKTMFLGNNICTIIYLGGWS